MAIRKVTEKQSAERLQQREELALEELRELGFRISLYEPRELIQADPLRGIEEHWQQGCCHAIADSATGKRKSLSAISAVSALDQARSWLKYQQDRIAPEDRFVIIHGGCAVPVRHQVGGDKATSEHRRQNTERRIVSFQSGHPALVDSHGDPLKGDDSNDARVSQTATH